jgi:predicted RNA-binding Zn-ribbon protein involved in translation (DUF1610 family)
VYRETPRTARVAHKCSACREAIAPGHRYTSIAIVFDGEVEALKRCARCQALHEHLRAKVRADGERDEWPDERLNCGHTYLDRWECEPPEDVARLAFALPGDFAP